MRRAGLKKRRPHSSTGETAYRAAVFIMACALIISLMLAAEKRFSPVVEAEAMGVPVIVTDIPGPTDAMREGETGLVVKKADVDMLTEAMYQLGSDAVLRSQFAANARPFIESNFEQSELMRHIMEDRKRLMGDKE